MFAPASATSPIRATSGAKETDRPRIAAASQASTNCSKRSLTVLIRAMPISKNGRATTIPIHLMRFRSNTPSVASQTAATPPRRASPRKNTSARLPNAANKLAAALTGWLLINIPSPGVPPKLNSGHKAFLARIVDEGPIPAIHGVVRWRACDLIMRLYEEFGLSVSDDTIYRALKNLGFSHVSARPKAYKQNAEAVDAFKKTSPSVWRKSARNSHPTYR